MNHSLLIDVNDKPA